MPIKKRSESDSRQRFKPHQIPDSRDLVEELAEVYEKGDGLVPLCGSLISVPSGIPIIAHLEDYLAMCIAMALGLDKEYQTSLWRWHPIIAEWPLLSRAWARNKKGTTEGKLAALRIKNELVHCAKAPRPDKTRIKILQQAFGALADWRHALQFLASILPQESQSSKDIAVGVADGKVVDSFFVHVTHGRTPTMCHYLLAHLASLGRMKLTLTTNFDDLIEQAHREVGVSTQVMEIHRDVEIPSWSLVRNNSTIVKLHGGKFGMLAGPTLDEEPTQNEYRHFRSFFLRREWTMHDEDVHGDPNSTTRTREARSHLIVLGFGGTDRRILLFIKDALQHIRNLKVYFICRSESGTADTVRRMCQELRIPPSTGPRIHGLSILIEPNVGSLLVEIYLRLARCMPPSGLRFPSSWQDPIIQSPKPGDYGSFLHNRLPSKHWLSGYFNRTKAYIHHPKSPHPLILVSPNQTRKEWGVSAFAWDCFNWFSSRNNCLWLDAEEIADVSDLKLRLLQAVSTYVGRPYQAPALHSARLSACFVDEMRALMAESGNEWIVFLNFRGTAGVSADMFDHVEIPTRKQPSTSWLTSTKTRAALDDLLRSDIPARFVLLLRESHISPRFPRRYTLRFNREAPGNADWVARRCRAASHFLSNSPQADSEVRRRFLSAICIFPEIRHYTALASRALRVDDPTQLWTFVEGMVTELTEGRDAVLRRKPGGFLWMHRQVRRAIRRRIEQVLDPVIRQDVQQALADWCMTLFSSTSDPMAAFQSVYHRCRVAVLAKRILDDEDSSAEQTANQRVIQRAALTEAANSLEAARARLLAWGTSVDAAKCLRGLLDVVEFVEDTALRSPRRGTDWVKRNLRVCIEVKGRALLYLLRVYRDFAMPNDVETTRQRLEAFLSRLGSQPRFRVGRRSPWRRSLELNVRLEDGVSAIGRRHYSTAEATFKSLLRAVSFPIAAILSESDSRKREATILVWAHNHPGKVGGGRSVGDSSRFAPRALLLFVLRRLMELHLLKYESQDLCDLLREEHSAGKGRPTPGDCLTMAERIYEAARLLIRFIPEGEVAETRVERNRLYSVLAGVLACREGCIDGARRFLNEALVCAEHLNASDDQLAKTVVDLREVYCNLQVMRGWKATNGSFQFRDVSRIVMGRWSGDMDREFTTLVARHREGVLEVMSRVRAWLGDVQMILDRIERSMSRHRKPVWWWMTARRYRLVWYQYRELLRFLDRLDRMESGDDELNPTRENLGRFRLGSLHEARLAQDYLGEVSRHSTHDILQLARVTHTCLSMARLSLLGGIPPRMHAHLRGSWTKPLIDSHALLLKLYRDREPSLDQNIERYSSHVLDELKSTLHGWGASR